MYSAAKTWKNRPVWKYIGSRPFTLSKVSALNFRRQVSNSSIRLWLRGVRIGLLSHQFHRLVAALAAQDAPLQESVSSGAVPKVVAVIDHLVPHPVRSATHGAEDSRRRLVLTEDGCVGGSATAQGAYGLGTSPQDLGAGIA